MMAAGCYGEAMTRYLPSDELATLTSHTPGGSTFAVTRLRCDATGSGSRIRQLPSEDAFLFWLQLDDASALRFLSGGREARLPAGTLTLTDLSSPPSIEGSGPFDSLVFYLSRALLDELASETQRGPFEAFLCPSLEVLHDPVARSLGEALLPPLMRPHEANALFVDHVCWALSCHLAHQHGRFGAPSPARGGLTPKELRRAQELLRLDLSGNLSLEQLARECGLSRSHFARAFRQSTGCAPHQWLMSQRVERARELLRGSRAPLRELARACGFIDASHFSRVFRINTGMTPSDYRRTFGA
jgi:AraC family transcriptional regulator